MKKFFGKIKKSWKENRVIFVLTIILVVCVTLMAVVMINYFLGTSKDKYGDRLEGIKKVEITNKRLSELEKKITEDETIDKCVVKNIGKMIYVDITFKTGISLVDAESKAQSTIEMFKEKELKFYDINYTLSQDKTDDSDGFIIMGAHNVNGSGLVWNNNTPISTENEE